VYVSVVIALGAVVVAATLPDVQFTRPGLFVTLLALSVISSAMKVDMPVGVGSSCISLSYAVDFTALLLLGPGPAILIAMASAWAQCSFRMKERNPPHRTVFSIASLALTVFAAGGAYTWVGGTYGQLTTALQPLLAAAMTYFLVNSLTVAAAFALATRRDVFRVWHDNFLWSITSYAVGAIAAGVAAEVFQRAGHWQTSLAFLPLCLTYRTYRIYLERIADEQRRTTEWAQLHRESTEVLARAIQAKDGNGNSHVERVQYYASSLARRFGLSEMDVQAVETAALLHDIGKLAVPEHILSKPGPLTPHERKKMQIHAQVGAEIVGAVPFPCPVAPVIKSHHERWDGMGYPMGLSGTDIPIGARILAVVDCFDAVTSERPYRRAVNPEAAVRILEEDAGKAFDPAIVKTFTELLPNLTPPGDDPSRKLQLVKGIGRQPSMSPQATIGVDAFAEIALANRESYTLYEIAHAMGRSMSLADTMTLICSKLSGLIPFAGAGVFIRERDRTLRCRFATGRHADLLKDAAIANGAGLSGWVAQRSLPLVNGLARAEFNAAGLPLANLQLESALVCPLIVGGEAIGTIAVFDDHVESYTDDHRRVLELISQQAAAVVKNTLRFEQTQEEALKDGLTGLANTRALQVHVDRELGRARRTGCEFSLILFDIDDFKTINDEYGHLVGDRALQEVARVLRTTTRPYDMSIRYGGDEFVVLLSPCNRVEAEERRRSFQDAVASIKLETADGRTVPLGASAGVGVFPDDGETYERLLARADRRMYRDKARRKDPARLDVVELPVRREAGLMRYSVGS
jgi:diguanylate cyclase (GGDEF)-like protein/putative nucleotidyltransferase with HDIG domain